MVQLTNEQVLALLRTLYMARATYEWHNDIRPLPDINKQIELLKEGK